MAILDKKERVIDVSLTEKGRELLAKNQFRVAFYAFSDDGVDYSGSLYATNPNNNISNEKFEDYVIRTYIPFETENVGLSKRFGYECRDLKSFLFTSPDFETIPEFKFTEEITGSITLTKLYEEQLLIDFFNEKIREQDNIEYLIQYSFDKDIPNMNGSVTKKREEDYAAEQMMLMLE